LITNFDGITFSINVSNDFVEFINSAINLIESIFFGIPLSSGVSEFATDLISLSFKVNEFLFKFSN
jgi:hypothetical protein